MPIAQRCSLSTMSTACRRSTERFFNSLVLIHFIWLEKGSIQRRLAVRMRLGFSGGPFGAISSRGNKDGRSAEQG